MDKVNRKLTNQQRHKRNVLLHNIFIRDTYYLFSALGNHLEVADYRSSLDFVGHSKSKRPLGCIFIFLDSKLPMVVNHKYVSKAVNAINNSKKTGLIYIITNGILLSNERAWIKKYRLRCYDRYDLRRLWNKVKRQFARDNQKVYSLRLSQLQHDGANNADWLHPVRKASKKRLNYDFHFNEWPRYIICPRCKNYCDALDNYCVYCGQQLRLVRKF